jgi:hypothetical protein
MVRLDLPLLFEERFEWKSTEAKFQKLAAGSPLRQQLNLAAQSLRLLRHFSQSLPSHVPLTILRKAWVGFGVIIPAGCHHSDRSEKASVTR